MAELRRVARRQVVITWDVDVLAERYWLMRDYLSPWTKYEGLRATLDTVFQGLDVVAVVPLQVPADCTDGFGPAYWRRPEAHLDPSVRAADSGLASLDQTVVAEAMDRLSADLSSGRWHQRNRDLLDREELDLGCRLVTADSGSHMPT